MNILLTSGGIPKIADFGIARILKDRSGAEPIAIPSEQGGTGNQSYMSPEQARGEAADFTSDLFMVGIVGYLLLAGRHPFAHPSGLFTILELLKNPDFNPDPPKVLSNVTVRDQQLFREYAAIVMRLLHREKAGRFSSANDAVQALDDVTPYLECPHCFERVPEKFKFCGFCSRSLVQQPELESTSTKTDEKHVVPSANELVEEGFRYTEQRNLSAAIAKYRSALQLDPAHKKAHWNLAFALNRSGLYRDAEEVATKGLALPTDEYRAGLLYERGFARFNLKNYDDALADIQQALEFQPKTTKFLYFRARIHSYSGNKEQAMKDAQEVLRREPDHAGSLRIVYGAG